MVNTKVGLVRKIVLVAVAALGGVLISNAGASAKKAVPSISKKKMPVMKTNFHEYTGKTLDGKDLDFKKFKNKTVLVVNVASKCGMTPQYKELQALHEKYAASGLVILGFPCNQFGGQEPGSAKEIQTFCEQNYGVEFQMMGKLNVNGSKQAPLYAWLTSDKATNDPGKVKWNFEKFLISPDGKDVQRFRSRVKPSSKKVIAEIEKTVKPKAKGSGAKGSAKK